MNCSYLRQSRDNAKDKADPEREVHFIIAKVHGTLTND